MRAVEDDDGRRWLLLKRSDESSLVRDPETGAERHLPNESLSPIDDASALETAARAVPDDPRRVATGVHSEAALGLLCDIDARGPLAVRTMLSAYELCESDLHGALASLRAAGLIAEREVDGERGYDLTETAREGLAFLRK